MAKRPPFVSVLPAQVRKPWARPSKAAAKRIRGRKGVALRDQVRREEPLCRACLAEGRTTATAEIDHIKPLSAGGTNDRANLQGLCETHHRLKSAAEQQATVSAREG